MRDEAAVIAVEHIVLVAHVASYTVLQHMR